MSPLSQDFADLTGLTRRLTPVVPAISVRLVSVTGSAEIVAWRIDTRPPCLVYASKRYTLDRIVCSANCKHAERGLVAPDEHKHHLLPQARYLSKTKKDIIQSTMT